MPRKFLNNDIDIPKDRIIVRTIEDDLRDMIVGRGLEVIKTYTADKQHEFSEKVRKHGNKQLLKECIKAILNHDESIKKDLGIQQETLVVAINKNDTVVGVYAGCGGEPLVGYHETESGLSFFGAMIVPTGGKPYFVVLYNDGTRLCAYLPIWGNRVNVDCRCILGQELTYGDFDEEKLTNDYKSLGIYDEKERLCWDELYIRKYEYKSVGRIQLNWNCIAEDIEARFKVVVQVAI